MTDFSFMRLGHAGRLGNQLWQIAWAYSQAKTNNGNIHIPNNWEYKHIFSVPKEFYTEPNHNCIDGGDLYYQELNYWNGLDNQIWSLFQPTSEAFERTIDYVGKHYEGMKKGCSVHHRLGDYLKYPNHFPIPTINYYINSIKTVLDKNPDITFYIFSDQIEKVIGDYTSNPFTSDLINNGKIIFFNGTPRPVEVKDRIGEPLDWLDLFAMSFCKNHIIANSTFSWWGAFLSNDIHPIYPSVWFGSNPEVAIIPWERMIPDNWIKINVN